MEHLLALVKLHALLSDQHGVIGEDHDAVLLPDNFAHLAASMMWF